MQINYCHVPSKEQRRFAEYLGKRWGENVKFSYLAIVTNPNPPKEYLIANQNRHRSPFKGAIAYYSPFTGGYIYEAIPRAAKVLSMVVINERLESEHYSPSDRLKVKVATALEKKGILQRIEPMTLVFTAYGKQLAQSLIPQGKTEDE